MEKVPDFSELKVLVFGRSGQVAQELQGMANVLCLGRNEFDLSQTSKIEECISEAQPDLIINAAAFTAVDKAEAEEELAQCINADAPREMARSAADLDVPLVHISTDYVFDGQGDTPFRPQDQTSPLGVYGRTKLAGENFVRQAAGRYAIFRTSWVFSPYGNNFVKTMLRLGAERKELSIVSNQVGGPTPAAGIAQLCLSAGAQLKADTSKSGVYHYSGAPNVSWASFAREIFTVADLDVVVTDIPTSEFPTPAQRPLNSRLDCSETLDVFGVPRPSWKDEIHRMLNQVGVT